MKPHARRVSLLWLSIVCVLIIPSGGFAQTLVEQQVAATKQLISLGVDRAVSSLPPSSGQSAVYEYDPALDTYRASPVVGPTALRSALTVARGTIALRTSTSYFNAAQTFSPTFYSLTPTNGTNVGATGSNLSASASVWVTELGATIGLTDRVQFSADLPLVNVHAAASRIFTATSATSNGQGLVIITGGQTPKQAVKSALGSSPPSLVWNSQPYPKDLVPSGNGLHLGRSSINFRYLAYADSGAAVGLEFGGLLPSPAPEDYAGSNSVAFIPRLIGQWSALDSVTLRCDVGYENDFDNAELTRFVWNSGFTWTRDFLSADLGIGGSQYKKAIQLAPKMGTFGTGSLTFDAATTSSVTTSTTSVDALFGIKAQLVGSFYVSGAVTVPVTKGSFEPPAIGTLALEYYL